MTSMSRMVVILFSDFPATSTFRAAREENRDSPRIVTLGTLNRSGFDAGFMVEASPAWGALI
jgi:hypothetical protein